MPKIIEQWNDLIYEIEEKNVYPEIKDLVESIEEAKKEPTQENIKKANNLFDKTLKKIKNYPESEYEYLEKLLRINLNKARREYNIAEKIPMTKWDTLVQEAENSNWEPVKELIDECLSLEELIKKRQRNNVGFLLKKEEVQAIEDDLENLVKPYIENNLEPYQAELIKREFETRIRAYKKRYERAVESHFGKWLKNTREEAGLTLRHLEEKTGITASYIHRLEKGNRKAPSFAIIDKLAKGLNVPFENVVAVINAQKGMPDDLSDETPAMTLMTLISINPCTIDGHLMDEEEKVELINLLNEIISAEWTENTKTTDIINILGATEKFKKISK